MKFKSSIMNKIYSNSNSSPLCKTSGADVISTIDTILFHLKSAVTNDLISSTYEITDESYEQIDKFYTRLHLYEERFQQELIKGKIDIEQLQFMLKELDDRLNMIDSYLSMLKNKKCDVTIKRNVCEHLIELKSNLTNYSESLIVNYKEYLEDV